MSYEEECKITREVICNFLETYRFFTFDNLCETIINKGGIFRTSPGVTLREYLTELEQIGYAIYIPKIDSYIGNPFFRLTVVPYAVGKPLVHENLKAKFIELTGVGTMQELKKVFRVHEFPFMITKHHIDGYLR